MAKNNRDTIICEIRKESKASIKQLVRVLEVGRGSVERAVKNMSKETSQRHPQRHPLNSKLEHVDVNFLVDYNELVKTNKWN